MSGATAAPFSLRCPSTPVSDQTMNDDFKPFLPQNWQAS
jgi:hypothetical protein